MAPDGGFAGSRFTTIEQSSKLAAAERITLNVFEQLLVNVQKYNGLVLRSVTESYPGTISHVFGAGHGATGFAAIWSLAGGRISV